MVSYGITETGLREIQLLENQGWWFRSDRYTCQIQSNDNKLVAKNFK